MTTLATDNFDRANAASLGSNWTTLTGDNTMSIVSNLANVVDIGGNYYNAVTWPNDQWSQATFTTTSSLLYASVRIRCATGAATYYNGGTNNTDSGNANRRIWKTVAGTRTSLASEAVNIAAGDVVYLEAQGTSLQLKVNGSNSASVTDSSIASGNAGIGGRNFGINSPQFNDWSGGDFAGAAAGGRFFMNSILNGLGSGGPFFCNPLG